MKTFIKHAKFIRMNYNDKKSNLRRARVKFSIDTDLLDNLDTN